MNDKHRGLASVVIPVVFLVLAGPSCHREGPARPPAPNGPYTGETYTIYDFSAVTTDSYGDSLQYQFDWDDGQVSRWTNPVASGETLVWNHGWTAPGTYLVRVHVIDARQMTSDWSPAHRITITSE